jgi:hypothetical protein
MTTALEFKAIAVPFKVSASVSALSLRMEEEAGRPCFVEFNALMNDDGRDARIRITFERCLSGKLLSAGGEARTTIRFGTITGSKWLQELSAHQRKYSPRNPDLFSDIRHYFLRGHDARVELLAAGHKWEIIR